MSNYYTDPHQNPYWQNINGNAGTNNSCDSQQTTKDPNWHPEPEYGRQLGKVAAVLGLLSLLSIFLFPIIMPLILGSVAVVLAVISKGKQAEFTKGARKALITGIVSIVLNVLLLVSSFGALYLVMTNSEIRAEANILFENVYGYSFDDLIRQIMENYGIDIQSGTMLIPEETGTSSGIAGGTIL